MMTASVERFGRSSSMKLYNKDIMYVTHMAAVCLDSSANVCFLCFSLFFCLLQVSFSQPLGMYLPK